MFPDTLTGLACGALALALAGCPSEGGSAGTEGSGSTGGPAPSFSLAWSEDPSWSPFGVADAIGLIDGKERAQGELEKKHNVDIVLEEADYDSCLGVCTAAWPPTRRA